MCMSLGQFFGPYGYLSYNEFKAKFPNVKSDFLLYEGILTAIKLQKKIRSGCKRESRHW